MFDCNTQNGQPRNNPIGPDEARELISEMMNVSAELITGYLVITVHECDNACDPPHLYLTTTDLPPMSRGYVAQMYLQGLREQLLNDLMEED